MHTQNVNVKIDSQSEDLRNTTWFRDLNGASFWSRSRAMKITHECVSLHFPEGIEGLLVPAMTEQQIRALPYVEHQKLSIRASYLLSTGYWRKFHYSETYLRKITEGCE